MRLHEQPAPQFIADDHVAADRNPLSADNGVDRVQLLAEAQVPAFSRGLKPGSIDRATSSHCRQVGASGSPLIQS